MKITLIANALLIFVCLAQAKAQTFIDPNRYWTVSEKIGIDSETLAPRTLHFKFGTDSLVAGLTYTKMLLSNDGSNWQVHSLWRMNDQNNIYFKRGLTAEVPIFNFMLNEGDRFGNGEQEIVIDSTKIKQFGTVQRKHLYGHYANMPNRSILWIDGIGSMFGPHINDNFFLVGGDYALICVEEAGQQVYQNPDYNSCTLEQIKPLISEKKQWTIGVGVYDGIDITYTTSSFKFFGDSLLDNVRYAKLYESDNYDFTNWKLYALMREEGSKLIRRDLFAIDENIVADFSVQPADTFITENGSKLLVEAVNQEGWGGEERKIITLRSMIRPYDTFIWIEGVGNNRLFARSGDILIGGRSYNLLCYSENNQQVYQNPLYNSCNANDLKKRLVAENKVWSQTTIGSGEGATYVSFFEKIQGDTLINGRLYQRVFRSYTSNQSVWEPCAFVREDAQTQQVYKFNSQLSQEVLLYDFSLEEGDSIYSNGEYVHVNSISYKHFGNSPTTLKHIEFVYQSPITGTWIEGVGSLDGLLLGVSNLTPIVGGDSYLVCYSEQGTQMWRNPQFETCFPEGTNNSIDVLDNSSLRYSIRDGNVYFQAQNLNTQGAEFVVYDIMGRAVYSMKLDRQSSWAISRSAIPDGTYIYQIQTAEGVVSGKLLVR